MYWINYSKYFENDKIKAVFSNLDLENNVNHQATNFAKVTNFDPSKLIIPNQTHSVNVNLISESGYFNNLDGVFTLNEELVCSLQVADCLPIFFAHRSKNITGLVHAGWRGLSKGIIKSVKRIYIKNNWCLSDFNILIGPSIRPCCFMVRKDVIDQFNSKFYKQINNFRYSVNLQRWAINQLLEIGAKYQNIVCIDECTYCSDDKFCSYRRDGENAGRMIALIGLDKI